MIANRITVLSTTAMLFIVFAFVAMLPASAFAQGYDNAFKGVDTYDAVFEVTQGNPQTANIVFWAVKNAYEAAEVKTLANAPNIAIVFHGPAVKLLSSDRRLFNGAEWAEVEKFQQTLRQMKEDGVKLEICLYAAKVMGVDKATILPEIDGVGNGFVSVIGYQMQGYGVVRIP
jgi:intracellular sulfur oxidation DsrE/DsrF family protein